MCVMCVVCICIFSRGKTDRRTGRQRGIFGKTWSAHILRPTDALSLRLWLNQIGDNLASVVDIADAGTGGVHRDLKELLVFRSHRYGRDAITRCRASHSAATLWTRPRRVRATVFSMSDPEIGIIGLILDTLDGLDSIADVSKVDKRAIFLLEEIDELDVAVLAEIAF